MKNVLAILAIGGFCLDGLSNLYNTFQFWPRDGFLAVIGHIGTSSGHFAGSAAGVFLAIAYLGMTPLHVTAWFGHKELTELLLAKGADVNAKSNYGTPLDLTNQQGKTETANLLRKHGGKTREELKAEGK